MTVQTSFAKKVVRFQNTYDCFLAPLGNDGELDLALLDVKNRVRLATLRKNNFDCTPKAYTPTPRKWPRAVGIRGSIRKRVRGASGRSRSAVTLEGHAMGRSPDDLAAEMLRLIGTQADAPPGAARLKLVSSENPAADRSSAAKEK